MKKEKIKKIKRKNMKTEKMKKRKKCRTGGEMKKRWMEKERKEEEE